MKCEKVTLDLKKDELYAICVSLRIYLNDVFKKKGCATKDLWDGEKLKPKEELLDIIKHDNPILASAIILYSRLREIGSIPLDEQDYIKEYIDIYTNASGS